MDKLHSGPIPSVEHQTIIKKLGIRDESSERTRGKLRTVISFILKLPGQSRLFLSAL